MRPTPQPLTGHFLRDLGAERGEAVVVVVAEDVGAPGRRARAVHDDGVLPFLHPRSGRRRFMAGVGDAVALFEAQRLQVGEDARSFPARSRAKQDSAANGNDAVRACRCVQLDRPDLVGTMADQVRSVPVDAYPIPVNALIIAAVPKSFPWNPILVTEPGTAAAAATAPAMIEASLATACSAGR